MSLTPTIRRANVDDAAAFARLMGDPAVFPDLLQLPHPDAAQWRLRLADNAQPGRGDLQLVAAVDGEVVGTAGLHPPAAALLRRRHVMGLGLAVAGAHQGRGVGSALMAALCDWADRWAGVLRIELTVFADNAAAQRLYQRFGFETEGRARGYALRDGVYADVLYMARLHPNPPRLPPSSPGAAQ